SIKEPSLSNKTNVRNLVFTNPKLTNSHFTLLCIRLPFFFFLFSFFLDSIPFPFILFFSLKKKKKTKNKFKNLWEIPISDNYNVRHVYTKQLALADQQLVPMCTRSNLQSHLLLNTRNATPHSPPDLRRRRATTGLLPSLRRPTLR
ncbi:hypothetical protein PanWU01x14_122970, partial [Parasponia andersonii]